MIFMKAKVTGEEELLKLYPHMKDELFFTRRAAVNKTIKGLRLDAGRIIRETIQVAKHPKSKKTPKQVIESRIRLRFATEGELSGRLVIKDREIPMRWFGPKQIPVKRIKRKKAKPGKKKRISMKPIYSKAFWKQAKKIGYKAWQRVKGFKFKSRKKKPTIQQTTAKVYKNRSRLIYPHGFGPNNQKLGYTIWFRETLKNYPLFKQEGVLVADIIRKVGGERRLRRSADVRLRKEVIRRIKRYKFIDWKRYKKPKL